jgi:hypothetical protein
VYENWIPWEIERWQNFTDLCHRVADYQNFMFRRFGDIRTQKPTASTDQILFEQSQIWKWKAAPHW